MRKLYTKFFAVTAIAAALVSCAKEVDTSTPTPTPVKPSEEGDFIMTVIASETKTVISAVDEKNYNVIWQKDDQLGVYEVGNGEVQAKAESSPLAVGGTEANFSVSLPNPAPSSPYKYAFVYPSSALGITEINSANQYTVNIKQNQTFQPESFDASADALISELIESETRPSTVTTRFARIGATARMVLKCPTTSEAIESITISTTEGYLSGYYTLNPATGKLSDVIVSGQQCLVLTPASTTNYSGEVVVWFRLAPITLSEQFIVTVRTNGHHDYTKTVDLATAGRTLEFADGKLTKFNVSMSAAVQSLAEGNYVILAKTGESSYCALKAEKEDGKERLLSVAYTGNTISYAGDADIIWSLNKSGNSYIFENDGKYLGYKGSDNESYWLEAGNSWTTTNYLLDVTAQATDGLYYVKLHSNSNKYLSKNNSYNFFAFYANTGQKADIVFVPATVDPRTAVTLSFANPTVNLSTTAAASYLGQDVIISPNNVEAISNNLSWICVDEDGIIDEFYDGALTLTGDEGTATVTVSFAGDDDYRAATASYTINVSAASGPQYELVSAANDVTEGDYIITWNNSYYLPSGNTSGTNPAVGTGITVSNSVITNTVSDDMIWTFTGNNTNGFTISDGTNILNSTDAAQGISITTNSTRKWTVSVDNTKGMLLHGDDGGSRYLAVYNNANWRYYTAGNDYTGTLRLYKLVDNTVWDLKSITAVKTAPTKTAYEAGEYFDPTGLVLTATYEDHDGIKADKTEDVAYSNANASQFSFSPSTSTALTTSDVSVTISYTENGITKTVSQAITVTAPVVWDLKSIAVTTAPTKTTYTEGESFDPTGMVVTATFENHDNTAQTKQETVDNANLSFTPSTSTALTTSDVSVTIGYTVSGINKTTTQTITVNADSGNHYQKVTSLSNVTAGEYIIVSNNTYLPNASNTSSAPAAAPVSISNDEVQNVTTAMTWTFTGTTSGMTIKSTVSGTPYLYAINNNNGIRVGNTSDTWEIATHGNGFKLRDINNSRYCATTENNNGDWRSYTTANSQYYIDGGVVYLYKLVDNTVWDLKNITAVKTAPTKTAYEAGEYFDPTGLVITATYEDHAGIKADKTEDVAYSNANASQFSFSPSMSTALTTSDVSVTISYTENGITKTVSQAITVTAPVVWDLKSIAVTTAPTKTTYTEGEFFDPTGLVVTPTFEEHGNTSNTKVGDPVDNANLTFTPSTSTALTTSDVSVSISYTVSGITKDTTQAITVNAASSEYYELISTVAELETGDYVIAGKTGSTYYAMPSISTGKISGTAVSVTEGKISATTGDTYAIAITKNNSGQVAIGSGTTYLQIKTSGTDLGTTTTANYYPVSVSNGAFDISNTRHLAWRNTSNVFGNYANIFTPEYDGVYLFKKTDNTVWDLKSIAVKTAPTKTTYAAGDNFDPTGLVITATYEDHAGVKADKTEDVAYGNANASQFSFSPSTSTALTTSNVSVTISYTERDITQSASQAITVNPVYAITIDGETVNGTVSADKSGAVAGATVNVTATPSSGYVLDEWDVYKTGESGTKVTVTNNSFTMPAYPVTVSATFKTNGGGEGGTLTLDFESAASSYTDWTITTIVTQQTSSNVSGHGGSSYYGDTDGKTSGSIVTKDKIASPGTLTFYISKESTNTTASSWLIKVSSNGSSWTQVGDAQSASSGITRGQWTEVVRDLSSYSNVYVKIEYSGTAAVRCIDDVSLTYN